MKILYLSHSRLRNSVNAVYIKGIIQCGVKLEAHGLNKTPLGYLNAFKEIRKNNPDIIIIGYDSPKLVTFCRLFTRKKIIYNALCSVYERMIVARKLYPRFSLRAAYYWLLDLFAVHAANQTMLETESQADYFTKLFMVPRKKLIRSWTGVDEDNFFYDPAISKYPIFTVIFRGALMPEAGAEYLIQAAKMLENENIKFIMVSGGMLLGKLRKTVEELKLENLEFISDLLPISQLREKMQRSHLSIGQLSDHSRLERTVPHKCYETLAMRLPYLTAANRGVMELLREGETVITCKPADASSVAQKILWAQGNYSEVEKISQNGYELYKKELKLATLAQNLLNRVSKLGQ